MASLRTTSAARLLRGASQARNLTPATRRLESSLTTQQSPPPPTTPATEDPNQPDYGARIDKATSTFTPVPKHLLDGSEAGPVLPAAVLSGAPMELQARKVRIYRPAKPATQSGDAVGRRWRMDWDVLGKGHRWENPLMGWQSSGDFMQGTHINFRSKEDAIAFAEKQGYEYFVQEPKERKFVPKQYQTMFNWSPGKLKTVRTK